MLTASSGMFRSYFVVVCYCGNHVTKFHPKYSLAQEEMRADGDILLKSELNDPASGSLYQLVRRMSRLAVVSRRPIASEDILVFKSLVEVYEVAAFQLNWLVNAVTHLFSTLLVNRRNGLLILLGN